MSGSVAARPCPICGQLQRQCGGVVTSERKQLTVSCAGEVTSSREQLTAS